nr:hypothetical protein [Tanacetum cinerariifolium]
ELCKAFEKLMKDKFHMSSMGERTFFLELQVKKKDDGIFISQDKYVAKILRKFGLTDGKSASILIDTKMPLLKDPDGDDVDVHIYKSILVKRIFRYLKSKPHLGLWYPKDSPFNLVAYSDSDCARSVVATSSTEAEYVTTASCCVQVLWIQNQLLDYGKAFRVFNSRTRIVKENTHIRFSESTPNVIESAFLYGEIEEEVCVCQPPGFEDPDFPDRVYKMSLMRELTFLLGLQVNQKDNGIFISHDNYVAEILRKFGLTDGKSASTPIDTEKPLLKDLDVKRIFRFLKGKPYLSLWYPKDSPFNLVAYSDRDYAGASLDRKSTIGDSQFLDRKKVIITEDTIRQALRIDDAAGVDCLSNEEIFAELARMGYEKPSSMASAVICLATSRKFNISKYIFDSMVVANTRRIGKGFSRVDTLLFDGMLVQQQVQAVEDVAEDEDANTEVSVEPTPPSPTPATPPPSPTQEHIPPPPQAQTAQPSSSPPQQPSQTADI